MNVGQLFYILSVNLQIEEKLKCFQLSFSLDVNNFKVFNPNHWGAGRAFLSKML